MTTMIMLQTLEERLFRRGRHSATPAATPPPNRELVSARVLYQRFIAPALNGVLDHILSRL